jgi:hypothetical protein
MVMVYRMSGKAPMIQMATARRITLIQTVTATASMTATKAMMIRTPTARRIVYKAM